MKPYSDGIGVAVGIQVRKHGVDGRRRERYRKTRILKNVLFKLDTILSHPRLHHPRHAFCGFF